MQNARRNFETFVSVGICALAILSILGVLWTEHRARERMERDIACLATNIFYEAQKEPRAGQEGVAFVTVARSLHGKEYPRSICDVV